MLHAIMLLARSPDPLGNAMDEPMRHQPSLKQSATAAIIQLLEEVSAGVGRTVAS